MEALLEIIFECVVQLFGDAILDGLLRSRHPIANTIGNIVVACFAGFILAMVSLAIHPHHLIGSPSLRIGAVIVFPIINGFMMSAIGRRFIRLGRPRSGFEYFLPALAFSLTFGALRLACAK